MKKLLCILLFLWPEFVLAQTITLPPKVEGEPGIPIPISATYDGKNVIWKTPDFGLTVIDGGFFNGDSGKALLFAGAKGTYRLWAFTAKDSVVASAECKVVIGGGGPGPGPDPLPPTDPFVQRIKAAYQGDSAADRADSLSKLASFYLAVAEIPAKTQIKTWGDMFSTMAEAAGLFGIKGKLPGVQTVIQSELEAAFPTKDAGLKEMTTADRTLAETTLKRVAAALEKAR
jgi:hypothetical protein